MSEALSGLLQEYYMTRFNPEDLKMNKQELIQFLHDYQGFTYEAIGRLHGFTRQRAHFIASNKNWTGKSGRPRKDGDTK